MRVTRMPKSDSTLRGVEDGLGGQVRANQHSIYVAKISVSTCDSCVLGDRSINGVGRGRGEICREGFRYNNSYNLWIRVFFLFGSCLSSSTIRFLGGDGRAD